MCSLSDNLPVYSSKCFITVLKHFGEYFFFPKDRSKTFLNNCMRWNKKWELDWWELTNIVLRVIFIPTLLQSSVTVSRTVRLLRMQKELTDICCSRKHHAASTHADAQSVLGWQSPSQPGWSKETHIREKRHIIEATERRLINKLIQKINIENKEQFVDSIIHLAVYKISIVIVTVSYRTFIRTDSDSFSLLTILMATFWPVIQWTPSLTSPERHVERQK